MASFWRKTFEWLSANAFPGVCARIWSNSFRAPPQIACVLQSHAQVQPGFREIRHDAERFAKLCRRSGGIASSPEFQSIQKMRLY